ncbi:MAG: hypothetical protein QOE72_1081 [Chloroflexota bacterium]|jgi:hypothetical protein|nr:hypothetical protein [Chloroflexota bacterium]
MKLKPIHTACKPVVCPTLYVTDRGTIVVQGFVVTGTAVLVELPVGWSRVEVPIGLLREGLPKVEGGRPLHVDGMPETMWPALHLTDRDTIVVCGPVVTDAEGVPEPPLGESWVEVPLRLLRQWLSEIEERLTECVS